MGGGEDLPTPERQQSYGPTERLRATQAALSSPPGPPLSLSGFKGGQNIRANAACTALGRPRARLWSPRFDRLSAGSPAKLERYHPL